MIEHNICKNDQDIYVHTDLQERSNKAKKELERLVTSYDSMLQIFNRLKEHEGFKGHAPEGFLEVFDIIVQFHKDLMEASPEIFTSIDQGFERFADFTNDDKYRSL